MTERYVVAIDQGTTSTRCIVFDRRGQLVSVAQREHQQYFPQAGLGRARRHGDLAQRRAARARGAAPRPASTADQVAALGIANQRETTVLWDRRTGDAGRPRRSSGRTPAPTRWSDSWPRRPAPTRFSDRCGLPLATYFSGPKLRWMLDHAARPARARRARRGAVRHHGDLADLEPHRRADGGIHVTDVTNASRTMLMDIHTLRLGRRAARRSSASRARCCREIRSSAEVYGTAVDRVPGRAHRRRARRPAGGAVRPDLLRPRRGQVHVRHRQLPAAQHRHRAGPLHARAAHHGRLPDRRRARRCTRWRARSRSPARWCSGSATSSG